MRRRHFIKTAIAATGVGFAPLAQAANSKRPATGYIRTNWSRDPYSFGSYSFVAKGASKKDHRELGQTVDDRLFFAGEACHPDYNSTVHAAFESGVIAAENVQETDANSVLVIGAGASGLIAADHLARAGFNVTILEARDRIGGRIWTQNSLGIPLDLGASWIHGDIGNPLIDRARQLRIQTEVTDDSYIIRGAAGRAIADDEEPDWLQEVVEVQHSAGASMDDINGRAYWISSDYGGEDRIMPGGYLPMFSNMVKDLDLKLGRRVSSIDLTAAGVSVSDQRGDVHTADAVIVTVPLGVLKQNHIQFSPPLPKRKQQAIERLGMGLLDKVYLRYDEVFWDRDITWIITPENGLPRGQFNQWLNLYPYIGEPIILAFNGAQPARDLAKLSDAEVLSRAQQTLAMAYPN